MSVVRLLFATLLIGLGSVSAHAQTDVPDALKNRPPVAAPTSQIDVAPIEVVRSLSELINDFGGGLIQGLLASHGLRNAVLIAAQDNRIIATQNFGCCGDFSELPYSDFLTPLAVLQLAERQQLKLEDRVSDIVAGYGASGITVGDVLTHRADPAVLRQIAEVSSGQDFRSYIARNILAPLSTEGDPQTASVAQVMGRLLVALLNDGSFEGTRILTPETIDLMEKTQFSIHQALPGWTYGFAQMRRNGRSALQRDGVWLTTPAVEARMVIVPESRVAYMVMVQGRAGASFWRVLDNALFDKILPPRDPISVWSSVPPPNAAQASAIAGLYEASGEPLASAAPLKSEAQTLGVQAAADGSLVLSGAAEAVLTPRGGGYWATEGDNLSAVASDGRLVLNSSIYRPLRWWKRPALYASLTLTSAIGAAGAFIGERRAQRSTKSPGVLVAVLVGAVVALFMLTLFVWHLSPVL